MLYSFPKAIFIFIVLFTAPRLILAQQSYPDPVLPDSIPRMFAKNILTDGLSNRDFTMSPSGNEVYYTIQHPKFLASVIIRLKKENGKWGTPEVAPFSGVYRDLEASFSPDGNTIFFSSDRPLPGGKPKRDFDIWKVSRLPNGKWSVPENLGPVVNSAKNEFYPSAARNGNLYFTVEASYGKGGEDIVLCRKTIEGYAAPESLPEAINTKLGEFNAFVDPDEKYLLFSSYGRADDKGMGDLYISHRDKNGNWLAATHLPAPLNSDGLDYCPYVTPDRKYLVFTSNRLRNEWRNEKAVTYKELVSLLTEPGNGLDDLYWVKFNSSW